MGFFLTIYRVCTGFSHYRDVRDLPVYASIKYLLKLITLLTLLLSVCLIPQAMDLTRSITGWAEKHIPSFTITSGTVKADLPQPYRSGDADFLFMLDTTGKITGPDPHAMRGVLVTADSLLFWLRAEQPTDTPVYTQRQSLRDLPDSTINADYVRVLVMLALWVSVPVMLIAGLAATFTQACFFSLATAILERGMSRGMSWSQLLNISLHAVTPAAIIFTTYTAMRLEGIDLRLVYLIAYGIFLIGGTNAARNPAPERESSDNELP